MAEDVKIPVIGTTNKKYIIVFGAVAAAYIGYRYWQSSTASDTTATDTAVEPTPDQYGGTGDTTSSGTDYGYSGSSTVVDSTIPTTNAAWTQQGVAYADSIGWDSAAAALALGKFLRSEALNSTEQDIVKSVLGAIGNPPTGGPFTVISDTSATPAKLTAPTGVKVVSTTANTAVISWNKVTGAQYYRVYRSGASTNVGATDAGNNTITVSGLAPNTSYQFWVAADTSTGSPGPISAKVTGKTKGVALKAPTGLHATPGTTTVALKWTPVSGATYYHVYVNNIAHGASDGAAYTVSGLKGKTTYSFKVAADTTTGSPGPASATVKAKTK